MRTAQRVLVRFVAPATTALLATLVAAPMASATPARAAAEICDNICVDGVRAATHDGYDRVVFDLGTGTLPQVTVNQSTSPDYGPPSGQTASLATTGSSYLFTDLYPARSGDYTDTNPIVKPFALPTVKAVQYLYEQHSQPSFGITLDGPVSRYNVFTLTAPNRVVVDIYR
ncbi:hypothetical protein ACIBI8_29575 [Streptomyces sp. NPDC050529]|uniref:AMIN-like domain-containing (lipo)protein n=1 Tax=unclassified Streptomyces TaxID=2593676 RepID=UPI002DDBC699|nr:MULTISPECIES: hypothetical protein [unclassified Streptomyces]WRZ84371.1 AMIN domain-containing protein [Streptomyces sp. NBC_01022]